MNERLKIAVTDYTSPSPVGVSPQDSLERVMEVMANRDCRHVPVVDGQVLLGIISDRDVHRVFWDSGIRESMLKTVCAKDVMTEDVFRVSKSTNIDEVVFDMADRKIGSAIVEDEDGLLYGIFTSTDALNALVEVIRDPQKV